MDKFLILGTIGLLIFTFVSFIFYSKFVNREIASLEKKNKELKLELTLKQTEVNTIFGKYFDFCEKHEKALDEIDALLTKTQQSLIDCDAEKQSYLARIEELESALEAYNSAESQPDEEANDVIASSEELASILAHRHYSSEESSDTAATVDDILTKGKNDIDFGSF